MKRHFILLLSIVCAACSQPQVQPFEPHSRAPALTADALVAADGARLPLRAWLPAGAPKAVIIALHGMNDYSHGFVMPGEYVSARGIALYAYDQRGFGAGDHKGIWPGEDNLVSDLRDMITVLRARYPNVPLYVLGESMGGAVAIEAFARPDFPRVDGVILSAPAVWGGSAMNPLYHAALWALVTAVPDKVLTGEGLHILASDNIPMLRELSRDPLVQKGTRADSVLNLVRLMDAAYDDMQKLHVPVLVLYGKHDEVVMPWAIAGAMKQMGPHRFAHYPQGYHLLLRDIHRDIPTGDIVSWIDDRNRALPSGHDRDTQGWEVDHETNHESHEVSPSDAPTDRFSLARPVTKHIAN